MRRVDLVIRGRRKKQLPKLRHIHMKEAEMRSMKKRNSSGSNRSLAEDKGTAWNYHTNYPAISFTVKKN